MTPKEQRRVALAPLIEQFGRSCSGAAQVPAAIALGGHEIELGAWEQSVLRQARSRPGSATERATDLLAECMAFQAKFRILMDSFERGPVPTEEELPEFLDRLATDVAVGLALQRELEREVSTLIKSGQLAGARELAAFRKKLVACGVDLKHRVGNVTFGEAQQRVASLLTEEKTERTRVPVRAQIQPFQQTEPVPQSTNKDGVNRVDWQQTCRDALRNPGLPEPVAAEEPERPHSRLKPLLGVFLGLVVIWAAFILPGLGSKSPPELRLDQFSRFSEVHEIKARPPSLFVELDAIRWTKLSEGERLRLIGEIAAVASAEGYVGMHAVTTDGTAVGQWLEKTGARLLVATGGNS